MPDRWLDQIRSRVPEHAARILELVRAEVRIELRKGTAADEGLGVSRIGGAPDLPQGAEWPAKDGEPMDFVAQIALADIAAHDTSRVLPHDGLLSFFRGWANDGWTGFVLWARGPLLPQHSKRKGKHAGITFAPGVALPPPNSRFLSFTTRGERYDPRDGETRSITASVELPKEAHDAYEEIYDRWLEERGGALHGLLGYDRPDECLLGPDEVMLFRLDAVAGVPHDFVEAAALYYVIERAALAKRAFSEAVALYGT